MGVSPSRSPSAYKLKQALPAASCKPDETGALLPGASTDVIWNLPAEREVLGPVEHNRRTFFHLERRGRRHIALPNSVRAAGVYCWAAAYGIATAQ